MDRCQFEKARLNEAERKHRLITPLLGKDFSYALLQECAKQTLVPMKELRIWRQAYLDKKLEGLKPAWKELSPAAQELANTRLEQLGEFADAEVVTEDNIATLAKRNGWTLRQAEHWLQRYRVGGLWSLAEGGDPLVKPRQQSRRARPPKTAGSFTKDDSDTAENRLKVLGKLPEDPTDVTTTVIAQAEAHGLSQGTVWNYWQDYQREGIFGLARQPRSDRFGHHRISPLMAELIRWIRLATPGCTVRYALAEACQRAEDLGEEKPTEWQVRSIFSEIPEPLRLLADKREKEFRNKGKLTHRMVWDPVNIIFLLDFVEPVHIYVRDLRTGRDQAKSGETRPYMALVVDSAARVVPAFRLSYDKPDKYMAGACLRDAFLPSPLKPYVVHPYEVRVDNGMALVAEYVDLFLHGLKVRLVPGEPGHPEARAILERINETINTEVLAPLAGYAPPNADRPHIPAKLTIYELEAKIQEFLLAYHLEKHSGIDAVPFDVWQTNYPEDKDSDPRKMDFLLQERALHLVGRAGIKHDNRYYWLPVFSKMVGMTVWARWAATYNSPDEMEIFDVHDEHHIGTAKASDAPAGRAVTGQEVAAAQRDQSIHLHQEIGEAKQQLSILDEALAANQQSSAAATEPGPAQTAPQPPRRAKAQSHPTRKKENEEEDVLKYMMNHPSKN